MHCHVAIPCLLIILCSLASITQSQECGGLFETKFKKNSPLCQSDLGKNLGAFQNVPILSGVYCFNNGTGICKAFAGRYEFYFNVWKQKYLGPVRGDYVDAYGYHERVPISYRPDGTILTADRPINWSRDFAQGKTAVYNLLSATSFNWCKYATSDNWPYKSSILDHDKIHYIYFFNRQSCIYNPRTKEVQHYNTRFLYTSNLRIDLDYNPVIFAMEDNLAKEVRLVKHFRQHWYEVKWKLLKEPKKDLKYFVEMDSVEKPPLIVDGKGPLLRAQFYNSTSDLCVSDYLTTRVIGGNSRLVATNCGVDHAEIADYLDNKIYEVNLHSIPRSPDEVEKFYGVDVRDDANWVEFAKDGYSFSATTTIPMGNNKYEVISLFSWYKGRQPSDQYDENYPETFLARYTMSKTGGSWSNVASVRKMDDSTRKLNLNYVDDIAYLDKCQTILVVFGPLYSEFKKDQFNLETKAPLGSIYDLGLNEMVTAFFAKDDKIYFYHRLNFVAEHTYKCGSPLVTARKVGQYKFRTGPNRLAPFFGQSSASSPEHHEERHFALLGMFKGSIGKPDASDAANYPWINDPEAKPDVGAMPSWIWFFVALGIIVLLIMFILGFVAFRRIRRRRYLALTQRSEMPNVSQITGPGTHRSGMSGGRASGVSTATVRSGGLNIFGPAATGRTGIDSQPSSATVRSSGLKSSKFGPAATGRTSIGSRPSSAAATNRSGLGSSRSGRPSSAKTQRSAGLSRGRSQSRSNSTRRSGLSKSKPISS